MLKYHSEKLAVAYGILKIPHGRPIRVIKKPESMRRLSYCFQVVDGEFPST
jgi:hypothetical protein